MNYEYTKDNRLDNLNNYMYTPYLGVNFIKAYFNDRLKNIQRFKLQKSKFYEYKIDAYFFVKSIYLLEELFGKDLNDLTDDHREYLTTGKDLPIVDNISDVSTNKDIVKIMHFSIEEEVNTRQLLSSLLFSQINNQNNQLTKEWIDLLIQRFEVTKKLYEFYLSGFRQGKGLANVVRLYWLFALLLSHCYISTKNLKYLNALLKVSDLLCSLDDEALHNKFPIQGLVLMLLIETSSVRLLSKNKGVSFDFA